MNTGASTGLVEVFLYMVEILCLELWEFSAAGSACCVTVTWAKLKLDRVTTGKKRKIMFVIRAFYKDHYVRDIDRLEPPL